jgi:FMN phosphatase YigB (HAD superfamily)
VSKLPACIAFDFGSTISAGAIDHTIGQKPVDPEAAPVLRTLHDRGRRILIASNTQPGETRWPALQKAGIDDLVSAALLSYPLGVRKDNPLFYELVIAAARCPAGEVLFVGDRIDHDVAGPMRAGMRACLVRPDGLRAGEALPEGAFMIGHVRELPARLELA